MIDGQTKDRIKHLVREIEIIFQQLGHKVTQKANYANIAHRYRTLSNYYCNNYKDYEKAIIHLDSCLFYAKKSNKPDLHKVDVNIKRETKTKRFYKQILKIKKEREQPKFMFFD